MMSRCLTKMYVDVVQTRIFTDVIFCFERGRGDERGWPSLRGHSWTTVFNSFFLTVIDRLID